MLYYNERASMTRSKVLAAFIIIILFAVVLLKRPCPSFGTRFCFPIIITAFIILAHKTHTHTLSRHNIPYFAYREIFFSYFVYILFSLALAKYRPNFDVLPWWTLHITFFFHIADVHGTPYVCVYVYIDSTRDIQIYSVWCPTSWPLCVGPDWEGRSNYEPTVNFWS